MKRQKVITIIILSLFFLLPSAGAMDAQLHSLPNLPGASIIWQEKSLYVNGVDAKATHLRTDLAIPGIISFYKEALTSAGWEFKAYHPENSALFFIKEKENEFFYVMVFGGMEKMPSDVYLIHSYCDLTVCSMLKDYFLQPVLAPDIPGKDLDDVSRYPQSRRRLSFFASNGAAFLLYEVNADAEKIAHFLSGRLAEQGWTEADSLGTKSGDLFIQMFSKGEDNLQITVMAVPGGVEGLKVSGRSIITVIKNIDREVNYPKEEEAEE